MSNFDQLRQKHPRFIYDSFSYQIEGTNLNIKWFFKLEPDISFTPTLSIPLSANLANLQDPTLETVIFNLGMVEMISYWKVSCAPIIEIKPRSLTETEQAWWLKLFTLGLGEFFFTNQIDFTAADLITFEFDHDAQPSPVINTQANQPPQLKKSLLLPLGGGKDSLVSLELLKKTNLDITLFALNPSQATSEIISLNSHLKAISATRTIDPKLLELNNLGYLNGHTPFSALAAFVTTLISYLYQLDLIAVSNEESANEPNTTFNGININHQYSKSFEFETDFRDYQNLMGLPSNYFSLLRPWHELQIAQIFSQLAPRYFPIFKSCNVGQKQNIWCHKCSKCLFAFLMLFPFIDQQVLTTKIFHANLFESESLVETALKLIIKSKTKPFDCVGSYQESKVAFYLSIQKYLKSNQKLPVILETVNQAVISREDNWPALRKQMLSDWNDQHFLTPDLVALLKSSQQL